MKPYGFIAGGDYQYWAGEDRFNPSNIVFHFNDSSALPRAKVGIPYAMGEIVRQINYYYGKQLVSYGGFTNFPKQIPLWPNVDMSRCTIHCALGSNMSKYTGAASNLGYTRFHIYDDIIHGIEIWLHIDLPSWGIYQVLIHEITHARFMLGHSFWEKDVSVMKVNYSSRANLERSQIRESYQASDLFGMDAKYEMPSLVGKYWVDDERSLIMPMVRYPIGATENEAQYFSTRFTFEQMTTGAVHQVLQKTLDWEGPWGDKSWSITHETN